MSKTHAGATAKKTKAVPPLLLSAPPEMVANNAAAMPTPFSAFVATQMKELPVAEPETAAVVVEKKDDKVSVPAVVKAKFVHTELNGRKNYAPGTIGCSIWGAADALLAMTGLAVTNGAVRLALPLVAPASISAGLTHWRQFHGIKNVPAVAAVAVAAAEDTPKAE